MASGVAASRRLRLSSVTALYTVESIGPSASGDLPVPCGRWLHQVDGNRFVLLPAPPAVNALRRPAHGPLSR